MSRQSCRCRLHTACRSVLAGALALLFLLPTVQSAAAMEVERPERTQADTAYYGWLTVPEEDTVARAELPEQGLALTEGQSVSLTLDIPQARRVCRRPFLPCGSECCAGQYDDGGLDRVPGCQDGGVQSVAG